MIHLWFLRGWRIPETSLAAPTVRRFPLILSLTTGLFFNNSLMAGTAPKKKDGVKVEKKGILTLKGAMESFLKASPEIQYKRMNLLAAQRQQESQMSWEAPSLGVDLGGKKGAPAGFTWGLRVQQNIPWQKLSGTAGDKQELARKLSGALAGAEVNQALGELIYSFYDALFWEEQARHNADRRRRLNLLERFLSSRPRASASQQAVNVVLRSRIQTLERESTYLEMQKLSANRKLAAALGAGIVAKLNAPWPPVPPGNLAELTEKWIDKNPRVRAVLTQIEMERLNRDQAATNWRDMALSGYYNQEPAAPRDHYFGAGITARLPWSPARARREEASEARMEAQKARLREMKNKLKYRLDRGLFILEKLAPEGLDKRNEELDRLDSRLDGLERAFRRGQLESGLFLDADTELHEARHGLYDDRRHYLRVLLEILAGADSEKPLLKTFKGKK